MESLKSHIRSIGKTVIPLAVAALSTLSGCSKKVEHGPRQFISATEIQADCATAVSNAVKFPKVEEREITCEKYLTGSQEKGGFATEKRVTCETINGMTAAAVDQLLKENDRCYAPNVAYWPYDNRGPARIP